MGKVITAIYYILVGLLIARVVVSWVPALQTNVIGKIVYLATNPVIAPVSKIIPPVGGLDLSVLIVWFALSFLYRWIIQRVD